MKLGKVLVTAGLLVSFASVVHGIDMTQASATQQQVLPFGTFTAQYFYSVGSAVYISEVGGLQFSYPENWFANPPLVFGFAVPNNPEFVAAGTLYSVVVVSQDATQVTVLVNKTVTTDGVVSTQEVENGEVTVNMYAQSTDNPF